MRLERALQAFTKPKYSRKEDVAAVDNKNIKEMVREKYSRIATQNENSGCCCSCDCSSSDSAVDYTVFSESYNNLEGYNPDADLGLGCGLPTQFAKISKGNTVVDLGSGAGNDCFVARAEAGENGKVIGVDFSDEMLAKAKSNAQKLGYNNVEFIKGDIEDLPLESNTADVIVSNCVLNLVPDKEKAFSQIYRVLKPGGHFSISDVVLIGDLPEKLQVAAEMYAGCVSGAIQKHDYLNIIKNAGFANVAIQKEKIVEVPDEILLNFLNSDELHEFKKSNVGIFSITVYGEKK
jgi:arsenite methyltransferase